MRAPQRSGRVAVNISVWKEWARGWFTRIVEESAKMRVRWLLALVLTAMLVFVTGCAGLFVPAQAGYGEEIPFGPGHAVQYPDFALEYVGQHRVSSDVYPRGFHFYDFRVSRDGTTEDVSWTDGTGVIEPADFTFAGADYTLEITDRSGMEPFTLGRLIVEQAAP